MDRKVITMCGSMRFWDKVQEMSERLEIKEGYVVIGLTPHVLDRNLTEDEKEFGGCRRRNYFD